MMYTAQQLYDKAQRSPKLVKQLNYAIADCDGWTFDDRYNGRFAWVDDRNQRRNHPKNYCNNLDAAMQFAIVSMHYRGLPKAKVSVELAGYTSVKIGKIKVQCIANAACIACAIVCASAIALNLEVKVVTNATSKH